MIKSTMINLPLYYLSTFQMKVVKMIERIQRDFPWDRRDKAGFHLVERSSLF